MDADYQEAEQMKALMDEHRQAMLNSQAQAAATAAAAMEEDDKEGKVETEEDKAGTVAVEIELPPNKTLFAQNLPDTPTDQMLRHLFSQYVD